jgi:hypothetical protein
MGNNQDACNPVNSLKSQGSLPLQFLTPPVSPVEKLSVARFRLSESTLGSLYALLNLRRRAADLFICLLEEFSEGKFHVLGNSPHFA